MGLQLLDKPEKYAPLMLCFLMFEELADRMISLGKKPT